MANKSNYGLLSPMHGAVAITPSNTVTVAPGREFVIFCGTAGNVKVGFADGSTLTFAIPTGTTILNWAVNQVFVTGTTAVATYANML